MGASRHIRENNKKQPLPLRPPANCEEKKTSARCPCPQVASPPRLSRCALFCVFTTSCPMGELKKSAGPGTDGNRTQEGGAALPPPSKVSSPPAGSYVGGTHPNKLQVAPLGDLKKTGNVIPVRPWPKPKHGPASALHFTMRRNERTKPAVHGAVGVGGGHPQRPKTAKSASRA